MRELIEARLGTCTPRAFRRRRVIDDGGRRLLRARPPWSGGGTSGGEGFGGSGTLVGRELGSSGDPSSRPARGGLSRFGASDGVRRPGRVRGDVLSRRVSRGFSLRIQGPLRRRTGLWSRFCPRSGASVDSTVGESYGTVITRICFPAVATSACSSRPVAPTPRTRPPPGDTAGEGMLVHHRHGHRRRRRCPPPPGPRRRR